MLAFGDIRDVGVYISQGDRQMALVCLVGLVPTGGDGARYISKIGKEMAEYSAENAAKVSAKIEFRRTIVEAIQKSGASEVEKVALLDEAFLGLGTRVVRAADGVTADDVLDLLDSTKKLKPTQTYRVVKRDTTTIWLEEGSSSGGWKHIFEEHIKDYTTDSNQFASALDPSGTNYRDAESIQNLIRDCVRYGTENPNDPGSYYLQVTPEKAIHTFVGSNGFIVTAHPMDIAEVPIPL